MTDPPVRVHEVAGFELLALLGEGGMGKVFKARQRSVDRVVALKVLTPKLSGDKDYIERFEREAKAAGKLSHPHIVSVIDRGEDTTQGKMPIRWIAFEFVDGNSLEGRIEKGKVPERETLAIVRAIADALRYASEKGLVHRDVKPDNIFLAKDGTPKLGDLGLAKFQDDEAALTRTGIVMGTPHFMAPEQAMGERDIDVRADVFSLGLVMYRALTGTIPWDMPSALAILNRHINEDCPDPRRIAPEVSAGTVELLRGMTARERNARLLPAAVVVRVDAILGKTAEAKKSARRDSLAARSSARVRTTSSRKTVATVETPKTEPRPESRVVLAVVASVLLAGAVLVVIIGRRGGSGTGNAVSPVVTDATPAPPVAAPPPPPPKDPERERLADALAAVRQASKIAADDSKGALELLSKDRGKAAGEAVAPALDLVRVVGEAATLLQDKVTPGRWRTQDELLAALDSLANHAAADGDRGGAISDAIKLEAAAWKTALKAIATLQLHLRAYGDAPTDFAPRESGPGTQYGELWEKGVQDALLPAVKDAERGAWSSAGKHADAAHEALAKAATDHALLLRADDSARALYRLANEVVSRDATPIAAWESARDGWKDTPLFFRRFVKIAGSGFSGNSFKLPESWTADETGLLAPTLGRRTDLDEVIKPALILGRVGSIAQVRLKVDRLKRSLEVLDLEAPRERIGALPHAWKKVDPTQELRSLECRTACSDVVQDLVFTADDKHRGALGLRVFEDMSPVYSEDGITSQNVVLRGAGLTVKELVFFWIRIPRRGS